MKDGIFPIKYGVLEVNEKINIANISTPVFIDVKVYIACKCYILSEHRIYRKDGTIDESYEVVFMYKKTMDDFRRTEPLFSGEECTNKVPTKDVFTDFSLASSRADELNKKAFRDFATTIPYDSEYGTKVKTGKNNHDKLLGTYKDHEKQLEENTKSFNEFVKKLSM